MDANANRERIKEGLSRHYGAINKVKEATKILKKGGYARVYIHCVLNGSKRNTKILEVAAKVLFEIEQEEMNIRKSIEKTINQINTSTV
ncbi:MAG: hypothetical protein AAF242_00215 [Bacteroidota bacterium]